MKIYLAGPMAGIDDHNFPAFNAKAAELRACGHFVYNPAEIEPDEYAKIATKEKKAEFHNAGYRNCLRQELRWICDEAEAIYLLSGWEYSLGANSEFTTAKAVKLKFYYESAL